MAIFNTTYKKSSSGTPDFTIEIATPPSKTKYYAGEPFAPAGMVVRGKFSNGLTIDIPHEYLVFSPSGELTLDDNRITVTFQSGSVQLVAYQDISVEEMPEFMWWSPHMTSNITPKPYKVAASSIYSASYDAYCAFDGSAKTWWHEAGGSSSNFTQWILFDFGENQNLKGIRLYLRPTYNTIKDLPHSFTVQGSNSGDEWFDILHVENAADVTDASVPREHLFKSTQSYRMYRLYNLIGTKGYMSIAEMEFLIPYLGI